MSEEQAAIAEAPVDRGIEAEASTSFDTAQLDAMLEQMRPKPKNDGPAEHAVTPPVEPAAPVAPVPPVAPEPPKAEAAPEPPKVADPFTPPPSVLGEAPAAPEAAPVVEDEMPEVPEGGFKSEKQKLDYAKFRESHNKLKAELHELRTKQQQPPPQDENINAQLADLQRRNEELNAIVERRAIQDHPYVKQTFDEPRRQLVGIAQKALEKIDLDPSRLGKILQLDGRARIEAVDELYTEIESPSTREKITNAIAQIDMLDEKREEFLEDRKGNVERMTQQEKAQRYQIAHQQQENIKREMGEVISEITDKYNFPFLKEATEPGSEQWNDRVKQDKAWIEFMTLKNTDPRETLKAIALGRQAPYLLNWAQTLQKRAVAAEHRVAELEGTLPGLNGASPEKVESVGGKSADQEAMDAAGVLPTDSLQVMSRKLGAYLNKRG